jgi:hypothetical protein
MLKEKDPLEDIGIDLRIIKWILNHYYFGV